MSEGDGRVTRWASGTELTKDDTMNVCPPGFRFIAINSAAEEHDFTLIVFELLSTDRFAVPGGLPALACLGGLPRLPFGLGQLSSSESDSICLGMGGRADFRDGSITVVEGFDPAFFFLGRFGT